MSSAESKGAREYGDLNLDAMAQEKRGMRVRVKLHGLLTLGVDDHDGVVELTLPDGSDVERVIRVLSQSSSLFDLRACMAFMSGAQVPLGRVLEDGDEVQLYYPFGGG